MADYLYPDICVIGGGPAGLAVASAARAHGAGVIVVEREALGGSNLYRGAIPARALAESARRAHQMRSAATFGVPTQDFAADLMKIREHIAEITASLSMPVSAARYEAIGARLFKAEAAFVDHRTLSASGVLIRARRYVIATGSEAVPLEIPGLGEVPHFTEDDIFENTVLPEHLVIAGAGTFGLEVAQAYRRLGAAVTVIDDVPSLGDADPELAEVVVRRLTEEGIVFRTGAISHVAPGIGIALANGEAIAASHLMLARKRRPAVEGLDLEAGGITRDREDRSKLRVRPNLTTSNSRVYAIGDAAGGTRSGQAALEHAELVVRNALLGHKIRNTPERIAAVVFTDPEIAEIGMTEAIARRKLRGRFKVLRQSFGDNERARAGRRTYGLVKLIVGLDGKVLGAGIVGPEAAELIGYFGFAIARGLKTTELAGFFAPYATLAQVVPAFAAEPPVQVTQNPVAAAIVALRRMLP